ncbi:MAG: aminoacyl-tRNA hydrolase [Patescibacteria group bacterium]|nr:aminoacyl-tRNA hydrolase [Patescibacteria group bacterium]
MSEFYNNKFENTGDDGDFLIPEDEYVISFASSSGPGGQNVNRRATKAVLSWNLADSHFSDEEKAMIANKLGNRITKEGILVITEQSARSQSQNKAKVIEKLNDIVATALYVQEVRIPTKPSKSSKERRLEGKDIQSNKKKLREPIKEW